MTKVSVILVNWNTRDLLAEALNTVAMVPGTIEVESIVVDNGSSDGSRELLARSFPEVRVIANEKNVGFATANNQAMAIATGKYFLLLNSDARLKEGALTRLIELAEHEPRAGVIGGKLLNEDGTFQASHARFPSLWHEFLILTGLGRLLLGRPYPSFAPSQPERPTLADYVIGACVLVRRDAYLQVGGFDEEFFMYVEEVDLCYRMKKAAWQVWYEPRAEIIHLGGSSSKNIPESRELSLYQSRVLFFRKHRGKQEAGRLALLLLILTGVKGFVHRSLRWLTAGRRGRPVVAVSQLAAELRSLK